MSIYRRSWSAVVALLIVAIANGCSTQAKRVNCDGRLEPINQSAPKMPRASQPEGQALETKEPARDE